MNTRQKIEKRALAVLVMIAALGATILGTWAQTRGAKQEALRSTIAFVSTRDIADAATDVARPTPSCGGGSWRNVSTNRFKIESLR